jgi:hypothetical protein
MRISISLRWVPAEYGAGIHRDGLAVETRVGHLSRGGPVRKVQSAAAHVAFRWTV